jgi:molybdopterin converting factor small subunit
MSSALPGISEEYFVLQSPAYFSQLRDAVVVAHPNLYSMMPSMMVLIDGVVAKGGSALKDGDEVDFVPMMAGG